MTTTTMAASERGRAVETFVAVEATQGVLPTTGWKPIRMYTGTFGMERGLTRDDQLGAGFVGKRGVTRRRLGLPGGTMARNVPLNLHEIGYWLAAGLKRTTPTGSTPNYVHVFDDTDQPTASLALLQKYASDDLGVDLGVALAAIRIQAQKADTTARAELTLVGMKDEELSAMPAGTVAAASDPDDFGDWAWQAKWNGVTIGDATQVDLTIDLGVERVQGLSGDKWPTRMHYGDSDAGGSFRLYGHGKTWREIAADEEAGELILRASAEDEPATRFFEVIIGNTRLARPQRGVGGPGQVSSQVTFGGQEDSDTPQVKIRVGNAVASY